MKVEIVSAWYNEETLAPFFLNHYKYADAIHIILDEATDDSTRDILEQSKKVVIHPIEYPDGIDWEVKSNAVNDLVNSLDCDWAIAVDSDEFIWPNGYIRNVRGWLEKQEGNLIHAAMWAVYRNECETDLDLSNPSIFQRRHGDFKVGITYNIPGWIKPCIVKPEVQIEWDCGIHAYKPNSNININSDFMIGAHWAMADPEYAVKRRLGQKRRQSKNNIEKNHGYQNFNVTKEDIVAECELHKHDPQLF